LVQKYDVAQEKYIPVPRVTLQISELHRQTTTDASGRYLFRDMPLGIFALLVNGEQYEQVQLSAAPQVLRHDIQSREGVLAAAPR
jgi:hypothetical protein